MAQNKYIEIFIRKENKGISAFSLHYLTKLSEQAIAIIKRIIYYL